MCVGTDWDRLARCQTILLAWFPLICWFLFDFRSFGPFQEPFLMMVPGRFSCSAPLTRWLCRAGAVRTHVLKFLRVAGVAKAMLIFRARATREMLAK